MPNWCYTKIVFHGNKVEIEDFYKKICEWTDKSATKNDFGKDWLGNILYGAGLGDKIDAEKNSIRCRGWVTCVEDVEVSSDLDATFYVNVETAWAPMLRVWSETITKLGYETIGFSYLAEEPGMELYQIYDPYGDFPERYYVDCWFEEEDEADEKLRQFDCERYFESDVGLKIRLMQLLETDGDLTELIKKAENYPFKNPDSYIMIHKFEMLDDILE